MEDQIRRKEGDKVQEMKGRARQAVGDLKRTARDVRGDIRDEADRTKREQDRAGLPRSR